MLNWGVMSAGGIAYVFCNAMRFTDSGSILAVASRTQSRMDRLVNDFDIPRQYTDYEALLERRRDRCHLHRNDPPAPRGMGDQMRRSRQAHPRRETD